MTTLYWGMEYVKVLLCYIFILFIWPSIVFRKYLRNKSKVVRFCFCATTQIVLINTAVLLLGLVHLLKPWVVNLLFYGTLLFSIRKWLLPDASQRNELRKLVSGTLGLRNFLLTRWTKFKSWLQKLCKSLRWQLQLHLWEYILLAIIVAYGVAYFSYSPFVDHSYGFGDMYTHHSWIYSMTQGQIFSAGVYPEGMHCIIYLMHTVSGLPVYTCNLFLGCIHIFVYLLSAYCLMREIFRWRGAPLLVLTAFLVLAVNSPDMIVSMSRLQRTLPGEYGLHTVFLCALFLLRFLKQDLPKGWWKSPTAVLKNENLLIFSMALAASVAIHFYVTIIAFFVCLPFAIVFIRRVLSRKRLLPLVAAVVCGAMIAILPMGGGLLSGIPFQGSINWALSIMNGDITEADIPDEEPAETPGTETPGTETPGTETPGTEQSGDTSEDSGAPLSPMTLWNAVKSGIRRYGYGRLLNDGQLGTRIMRLSVLLAAFCLCFRLICMLPRPLRGAADTFDNYLPIIGASFFLMIIYAAPLLRIPELISYNRVPSTAYILVLMVAAIPADILFRTLHRIGPDWLAQAAVLAGVIAVCVVTVESGNYHGYFYNELTRYRSVVDVTNSIVESFPRNTYTIVSSTDDIYQTIQYGRHEELLDFLKSAQRAENYYLPTEYIFVYVEKKPIQHAQYHFSSGPAWLATDAYADELVSALHASVYPEIFSTQITEEDAQWEVSIYPTAYASYKNSVIRTIINAKAYKWCQDFADLYDHEMKIYYEDEDFVCYYFRQNTYSLYDLSIWS